MESNTKPRDFEDSLLTDGEIIEDRLKPETSHLSVIGTKEMKNDPQLLLDKLQPLNGETDDKLSTADMDNKNINSLLNGETKDESQIDYVNDKPLTEEKDCESPAAESDDKSSTGYTDDKLSTQSDEPPSEKEEEQPLHAGWLTKYGGIGGTPFFQTWNHVWVSLDKMGKMFRVYSGEPPKFGKRPFTRVSFFSNCLAFAKSRNDETMLFSDWPVDADGKSCFVVATCKNQYYFIAETEEEKTKWLESICAAKMKFTDQTTDKHDEAHSNATRDDRSDSTSYIDYAEDNQILHSGWLNKHGGIGETWHRVWVSLNSAWEMLRIYPDELSASKLPFTSGRFLINYLVSVEDLSIVDKPLPPLPADIGLQRCFVVTTPDNSYYFEAKTENEKNIWLTKISKATKKYSDGQHPLTTVLEFALDKNKPSQEDNKSIHEEDNKPKPGDDKIPKPGEDNKPKPGEDDKPKPGEDGKSKPVEDNKPTPGEDNKPKPGEDGKPKPREDDKPQSEPRPGEDGKLKPGEDSKLKPEDDKPKPEEDGKPKPGEDDKPKPGQDDKPKPGEEDKQKPGEDGKPKPGEDNKPNPREDDKPKPGGEDKPQSGEEDKPKPGEDSKPKPGEDDKPKPGEDDKPKPGEDDKLKPGEDNKPKPGEDDKPQSGEEYKPKPGEDSKPKPVEEDKPQSGEDDKPKPGEDSKPKPCKPKPGEDDKPQSGEDDKPKPEEDSKPKPGEDGKPKPGEDDKPQTGEDDKPKPGKDGKPKPGEDGKPKPGEDGKPKPEDDKPKQGEDDKPKPGEDDKPKPGEDDKPQSGEEYKQKPGEGDKPKPGEEDKQNPGEDNKSKPGEDGKPKSGEDDKLKPGENDDEDDNSNEATQPLYAGWLSKYGGFGGIPLFQSWQRVWVSLDKMGKMFRVYSDQPQEFGKKPFTRVSFFINFLEFAIPRNEESVPFSYWPSSADDNRCFVVGTPGNWYYFVADTEEEKIKWLESIHTAKEKFMDKDNEQQESEDERNVSDSKSDSVDCEYVEDDKANQASQGQQDQESAILDSTTYNYSD